MGVVAAKTQKMAKNQWSELPEELVIMIAENISLYADYVRFCAVCVSWRNSALGKTHINLPFRQRQFFPFVLLPYEQEYDEDDNNTDDVGLLSVPENGKIYHPLRLPEFRGRLHWLGSSHGWLVRVDVDSSPASMSLINPFTKAQLPLPPCAFLTELNPSYVNKVVLSSAPSPSCSSQFQSSSVLAIVVFELINQAAISRPGDKAWTYFGTDLRDRKFIDVAYYRDHLYILRVWRDMNSMRMQYDIAVFHLDMGGGGGGGDGCPVTPKLVQILEPPKRLYPRLERPIFSRWGYPSLVESCGDLLLVEREDVVMRLQKPGYEYIKTSRFAVYKLCLGNHCSDDKKTGSSTSNWEQINNLGDRMLFLGVNSSFSLSSHDFPPGCFRGNCIYFTHQYISDDRYHYVGVFYLKDKRVRPLMPLEVRGQPQYLWGSRFHLSPIWLTPNPN